MVIKMSHSYLSNMLMESFVRKQKQEELIMKKPKHIVSISTDAWNFPDITKKILHNDLPV